MTEPVEGWIHRAAHRCGELGPEHLAKALAAHAHQEAAVPAGRAGVQPELSLVYSTGQGNGPFGLGWALSIPGVSRDTSKRLPVYDDSQDMFLRKKITSQSRKRSRS